MGPLNRPFDAQRAAPEHYKTYRLIAPIRTHRRAATCAEVDCPKRQKGFKATFDVSTVAGRDNAMQVERSGRRRTFTVAGPLVTYVFPAGQDCFDRHTVSLEREPIYVVQGGDHRGNPRSMPRLTHKSSDDWVDDFANHQLEVVERTQRG